MSKLSDIWSPWNSRYIGVVIITDTNDWGDLRYLPFVTADSAPIVSFALITLHRLD